MRNTKLTADEIHAAEEASENRRLSRGQGFKKMHERDKAVQLLSNGAVMLWHVPRELGKQQSNFTGENGEIVEVVVYPPEIPEDSFGLIIDGKKYLFNLDEFRKWLRWA